MQAKELQELIDEFRSGHSSGFLPVLDRLRAWLQCDGARWEEVRRENFYVISVFAESSFPAAIDHVISLGITGHLVECLSAGNDAEIQKAASRVIGVRSLLHAADA